MHKDYGGCEFLYCDLASTILKLDGSEGVDLFRQNVRHGTYVGYAMQLFGPITLFAMGSMSSKAYHTFTTFITFIALSTKEHM